MDERYKELMRAQRKYDNLITLIDSGEYKPTARDFRELEHAKKDLESAYADTYIFEEIIDKENYNEN